MDIQIRKQLEQLEYIKDKLEYIEYSESLQCYVEKLNGIPTGVAAWVNGAFYGFEQAAKAQAVPDGFVLVERFKLLQILGSAVAINTNPKTKINLLESDFIIGELKAMIKAQESTNEEITIRCTNCGLEFESDYDLEQNLIDPETGEIHDGCPTCKTDAYLMDLIKYPDQEPTND